MARKTKTPQLTPDALQQAIDRLQRRLDEVRRIDPASVIDPFHLPVGLKVLSSEIEKALVQAFGTGTLDYKRYSAAAVLSLESSIPSFTLPEAQQNLADCRTRAIELLSVAIKSLEERQLENTASLSPRKYRVPITAARAATEKGVSPSGFHRAWP
jgi:hypothetical protein